MMFILFTANILLRSLQVSAGFVFTTEPEDTGFVFTTEPEEDVNGRPALADFEVDCSRLDPDYVNMDPSQIKRIFIPTGCSWVFGEKAFRNCAKMVCPCRDKVCGETCVPTKPGSGPFQCQAPTSGGNCVPATEVKCTTSPARTPFMPTTTTPEEDITTDTTTKVDCSLAGTGYKGMSPAEIRDEERFMPPGCSLITGRGSLIGCVKIVCPCRNKECGDTCDSPEPGTGPFKCQAPAQGYRCVPATDLQCPAPTTTTTTVAATETTTAESNFKSTASSSSIATTTTTESKKLSATTVKTTTSLRTKKTTRTIDNTGGDGDGNTIPQLEVAVVADRGCAKEITLAAVLLPVSLLLLLSQ